MIKRRVFFKHAGAFALGTLLLPGCNSQSDKTQTAENDILPANPGNEEGEVLSAIGLQLYSVKDVLDQDLKGTLQKLADMGYTEVESYPGVGGHYYGIEPKEFSKMLNDLGMTLVSSHFGSGSRESKAANWHEATMLSDFETLVSKAAETGQTYLTCSWMDQSLRQTPDDLKKTAELFNKTGEICKKAGLKFAYHNHAFEFEKVGEHVLYDYLLENTDPELVLMELDMYWVAAAKKDPIAYFEKYPDRFPLGHVKDMSKADNTKNDVIGKGTMDYAKILRAAKDAGMKHFFVEQESFTQPSMEAMAENYEYLSTLKI